MNVDIDFQETAFILEVKERVEMIVCHCHRVSDREIRECVRSGATSVSEIGRSCAAGTSCGGCRPEVARIIDHEAETPSLPPSSLLRGLRQAG